MRTDPLTTPEMIAKELGEEIDELPDGTLVEVLGVSEDEDAPLVSC